MRRSSLNLVFSLFTSALLCGCGVVQEKLITTAAQPITPTAPVSPATTPGSPIVGNVHGGDQPIVGAHIYLFAANPAGYGAPSISMLNAAQPGVGFDDIGNYVATDSNGSFLVTGDYTCTTGQQVYLLALGGNPGGLPLGQSNSAAALMAALGACPEGQNTFANNIPYVTINEVATVAAVYALSGFMTDATHVGYASTPGSLHGIDQRLPHHR